MEIAGTQKPQTSILGVLALEGVCPKGKGVTKTARIEGKNKGIGGWQGGVRKGEAVLFASSRTEQGGGELSRRRVTI